MFVRVVLACVLAAAPIAAQQEEKPKVPKDSVLVSVTSCLKGRVVRAEDVRQPDTTSGLVIRNRARSAALAAGSRTTPRSSRRSSAAGSMHRQSPRC